jgi:hypothetical protein
MLASRSGASSASAVSPRWHVTDSGKQKKAGFNRHGDSFLDIGFGPTGTVDRHGGSLGARAQVEEQVANSISITFTTTVTPRLAPDGGVDLHPTEVGACSSHL